MDMVYCYKIIATRPVNDWRLESNMNANILKHFLKHPEQQSFRLCTHETIDGLKNYCECKLEFFEESSTCQTKDDLFVQTSCQLPMNSFNMYPSAHVVAAEILQRFHTVFENMGWSISLYLVKEISWSIQT